MAFKQILPDPKISFVVNEQLQIKSFHLSMDRCAWEAEEVIGANWLDLFIAPQDRKRIKSFFEKILTERQYRYHRLSVDICCKNGKHRFVDFIFSIQNRNNEKYIEGLGYEHHLMFQDY